MPHKWGRDQGLQNIYIIKIAKMIKLIYTNISGETTLKNPYKTNFTLSHKPETWLVSSNNNKHTSNNLNNKQAYN